MIKIVRKLRKMMINFSVFILAVFLALLIGEGIIRLFFKKNMTLFPRYHAAAHYGNFIIRKIRPNAHFTHTSADGKFEFVTNNKGFRNKENIDYANKKDEIRILCIGDSHTQGYEVNQEQTFSYITETVLKKKGLNARVLNAGVSGFSTAEELVFLENEGYKYHPQYVVLGFYANDLNDNLKADLFRVNNDSLIVNSHQYTPGIKIQNKLYKYSVCRYLGEHSYLYAFIFNAVWDHFKEKSKQNSKQRVAEYAIATQEPVSNTSIQLANKLIERLYNFCKSKEIKLIIIDIPRISLSSSIPASSLNVFKKNCDTLFFYNDLASNFKSLASPFVQHGQRHISSESHNLFGKKIAEYILQNQK